MAKIQITSDTFGLLCKFFVENKTLSDVEKKDIEAELYTTMRTIEKENKRFESNAKKGEKVYFDVFYGDKVEAKNLGAKWDSEAKSWYAIEGSKECDALRSVFETKDVETMRRK